MSDNQDAARSLTESVLTPDTGTVVWFDAVPDLAMTRQRRAGFEAAARHQGCQARVLSGARYDRETGARLMRQLLAEHSQPAALVTASYTLLQGVLDVLLERPEGLTPALKLATFGDDRLLDFLPVPVHSLPQNHEAIAAAALDQALAAISHSHGPFQPITINRRLKHRPLARPTSPGADPAPVV